MSQVRIQNSEGRIQKDLLNRLAYALLDGERKLNPGQTANSPIEMRAVLRLHSAFCLLTSVFLFVLRFTCKEIQRVMQGGTNRVQSLDYGSRITGQGQDESLPGRSGH